MSPIQTVNPFLGTTKVDLCTLMMCVILGLTVEQPAWFKPRRSRRQDGRNRKQPRRDRAESIGQKSKKQARSAYQSFRRLVPRRCASRMYLAWPCMILCHALQYGPMVLREVTVKMVGSNMLSIEGYAAGFDVTFGPLAFVQRHASYAQCHRPAIVALSVSTP